MWNWSSATRVAQLPDAPAPEVKFRHEEIESLAERLIRKSLLRQHVEPEHKVYQTEERLVREAREKIVTRIREAMKTAPIESVKNSAFFHLRKAIRIMIRLHDVDEDLAEEAAFWAEHEAHAIVFEFVSN